MQQHVAARIVDSFEELEEDDVQSRPMGSGGVDLMMSPLAQRTCPISVECKNTRGNPSLAQVKQATSNAYKDTLPVVAWKPHGAKYEETLVICRLEDLLAFFRARQEEAGTGV